MSDKIQSSYKSTKNIYDVIVTHKTWWSSMGCIVMFTALLIFTVKNNEKSFKEVT